LLWEILKEVQTSNSRVAELEKKLQSMQEEEIEPKNRKKKKLVPSPQVRVSVTWIIVISNVIGVIQHAN